MVDGRIPEKEPEKAPSPWSVNFADAVAKDGANGVVRDNLFAQSLDKMPRPQQSIPAPGALMAPLLVPDGKSVREVGTAPQPPFAAIELPDARRPAQPGAPAKAPPFALPESADARKPAQPGAPAKAPPFALPESPDARKLAQPGAPAKAPPFALPESPEARRPAQPGAPAKAPPFALPESPDARKLLQPGAFQQTPPFGRPSPFGTPPGGENKPTPLKPAEPAAQVPPQGGRAHFGRGVDQTTPWRQWIQENPGGVTGQPRPGGLPGGLPAPGGRPGFGAPPGATDRPGINPSTEVINVSPEGRKAIQDALHDAVPVQSHLIVGGTWGALLNTTKWGLDVAHSKGKVQWWGPYSPLMKRFGAEELQVGAAQEKHAAAEAAKALASDALGPATARIKSLLGDLDSKLLSAATPAANPAMELLAKQHGFLKDANNIIDPVKIQGVLGSAEEVANGSKLFLSGSTEANQLLGFANHAAGVVPTADATALLGARQTLISDIEAKLAAHAAAGSTSATALSDAAVDLLSRQKAFVASVENLTNLHRVASVIGSAEQVSVGDPVNGVRKLFVAGSDEAKALLGRAQVHSDFYKARSAATAAEANMARYEGELQALKEAGAGNGLAAAGRGFMIGTLVTGSSIGAGYLADKYLLGHTPNMNGFDRFLIDGVAVPGVLLTPGIPARYKVGAAIGLFGLARAKSYFDDAGVPALSKSSLLLRPNTIDTLGLTTAALAPLGIRGKLAIAGGTLIAGRLYNGISHLAGWDGPDGIELRDNLVGCLSKDVNTKSGSTYSTAVDSGLALSRHKAGEGALDLQLADLINSQKTMSNIDYLRQHAILTEAAGLARLEKGSRIVEGGSNSVDVYGDDSRILKDKKYDFLGESMLSLCQAFTDLSNLRYAVWQEKNKVSADKALNDAAKNEKLTLLDGQIKMCDAERDKIDKTLKGIFGEQDMDAIYKDLTTACRTRSKDMDQILFKRRQLFETLSDKINPEVRAKFARDLAVGFLAQANYRVSKNNGEEANIMYLSGIDYLKRAETLVPTNPNNPKLEAIATKLPSEIQRATNKQYESNLNNPNQLKTPVPGFLKPAGSK